jgi:serine/threonine protein kinase
VRKTIHTFYAVDDGILGKGSFAEVRRAVRRSDDLPVAIKVIEKARARDNLDALTSEIQILRSTNHPGLISLLELFESKSKVYLVMDLVSGGELFDSIVKRHHYSERDASNAVRQVAEALAYLHSRNIVHRDIKAENILLDANGETIKIADFGLSTVLSSETLETGLCGTPGYLAPEILLRREYAPASDVWALGVLAYILLCGFTPFQDDGDMRRLFKRIVHGQWEFLPPYWDAISDSAKDLVSKMLQPMPELRLTAAQVLEHPWIASHATVSGQPLPAVQEGIATFNARRRLRAGVMAVIAARRFEKVLAEFQAMHVAEDSKDAQAAAKELASRAKDAPAP